MDNSSAEFELWALGGRQESHFQIYFFQHIMCAFLIHILLQFVLKGLTDYMSVLVHALACHWIVE